MPDASRPALPQPAQAQLEVLDEAFGPGLKQAGLASADAAGRLCIQAAPPLNRGSMVPEPWFTNPIVRLFKSKTRSGRQAALEHRDHPEAAWQKAGRRRRLILLFGVLIQTAIATWYMRAVLPYQGTQWLEIAILALFALLFCWVSSGFWTAMMGFIQLMQGNDPYHISANTAAGKRIAARSRTAIVMPICNEDVSRVFAGLRATYESLKRTGEHDKFDFFILSDSFKADICVAEQQAWMQLCKDVEGFGSIHYRRRRRRVKRKSGNIDDFCRRWGKDYDYMVVLDADSVMTGACLQRLVVLMDTNPRAGIIQTAPSASGMDSLYARIQQFAGRVYGPLFTAGLHFWQLGESHYWGHNAIIRLEPFMQHCALAPLPGKGSFAGAILSHDFVEAALMRRAGWGVWIAYDLPGSFEDLPPNLLDELQRDQRWCHGNLMNFRLFLIKGFHPVHRAVFLTGVMSYLSAPLWFLFLLLSTALLAFHTLTEPQYFVAPHQLFPIWPQWHPKEAIALFSTTAVLLFLPKVLSVLLIWVKGAQAYGGRFKLLKSMLLEVLFSMLLAPIRMLFHTRFVAAAFLGWKAQWKSPARGNDETPWSYATRRHFGQTLLGVCWAALVFWLNPNFLWWMTPILASLLLAIPLSVLSSRVSLGVAARNDDLFRIPEETRVPVELADTQRYTERNQEHGWAGFLQVFRSGPINALAVGLARSRHQANHPVIETARQQRLDLLASQDPLSLSEPEKVALLDDPALLLKAPARTQASA